MKECVEINDANNTIKVVDEDSSVSFTVFPEKKQFKQIFNCLSADCLESDGKYHIFEYRISADPTSLHVRLLEESNRSGEGLIKDGVVLETEVLKEQDNNHEWAEKRIDYLKTLIEWYEADIHNLNYYEVIFYILSKHPEVIPETEYRKFLRQTLENVKSSVAKVNKTSSDNGLEIKNLDSGYKVFLYKGFEIGTGIRATYSNVQLGQEIAEREKVINSMFDKESDTFVGITKDMFWESKLVLKFIDNLLNKSDELFITDND